MQFSIVHGNEEGLFYIGACSGLIFLTEGGTLDFNAQNVYNLTVEVMDSGIPPLSDTGNVILHVMDANQAPAITVDNVVFTVPENVVAGFLLQSAYGSSLPFTDPDMVDSHKWSITRNDDDLFQIDEMSGNLSVTYSPNYEFKHTYSITVQVIDKGFLSDTSVASISIINEVRFWFWRSYRAQHFAQNDPPEVNYCKLSVLEDAADGTVLTHSCGSMLTASDPESGFLAYSILSGNVDSIFGVRASVLLPIPRH